MFFCLFEYKIHLINNTNSFCFSLNKGLLFKKSPKKHNLLSFAIKLIEKNLIDVYLI